LDVGKGAMMSKFYVTTPIYYVNDKPHIGHSYTTILADVLARYHRLMGEPVFFLTGTDEHGQKVQQAATKAGVSPLAHCDATVVRFQELWRKLEITNDDFIRTTDPRHAMIVQEILQDLYDRDEIYRAEYDGWYCVPCERFFTEKDLADGKCPDCGRPVDKIKEANYFFRMGKYQAWLVQYINDHPQFIQPDFRRNETLGFLRKPLQDLCISRPKSRLAWGIELPFDSSFVCYVWFDALVNYISAMGYRRDDAQFAKWWPASCQLIGKDILTTHTVYWPTMLKAMGLPMPDAVFAHGWWMVGQSKMGKSLGNMVNPMDMIDRYGVDAFRYFLGQDASFSEEIFEKRYNADLANDLGNLLSRLVKLMQAYTHGAVPAPAAAMAEENELKDTVMGAAERMVASICEMRPDLGIAGLTAAVRETNRYLEKTQPWTLAKTGDSARLATVLYTGAEALRIVAGLLAPVMPGRMAELRAVLGLGSAVPALPELRQWGGLKAGTPLGQSVILFPKLTPPKNGDEAAPAAPAAKTEAPPAPAVDAPAGVALIEYADFQKVQLRTARIVAAEHITGADKLLKLKVEIGGGERQIVAGIALHYAPEALIGRAVVVVVNLKPAKLRGVESNGMLLAATSGAVLRLVTVDGELPSGAVVK
jgi:methionyl-tRNA synthetase